MRGKPSYDIDSSEVSHIFICRKCHFQGGASIDESNTREAAEIHDTERHGAEPIGHVKTLIPGGWKGENGRDPQTGYRDGECAAKGCAAQRYRLGLCQRHDELRRTPPSTRPIRLGPGKYARPDFQPLPTAEFDALGVIRSATICHAPGCAGPVRSRGVCPKHVQRMRKHIPATELPAGRGHVLTVEQLRRIA